MAYKLEPYNLHKNSGRNVVSSLHVTSPAFSKLVWLQARFLEVRKKDKQTGQEGFDHYVLAGGLHGWMAAAAALKLRPGQVLSSRFHLVVRRVICRL